MDDLILGLSRRLFAAASVLGALAEKDGRVREIMRLREALERIAEGASDPKRIASEALRWE